MEHDLADLIDIELMYVDHDSGEMKAAALSLRSINQ